MFQIKFILNKLVPRAEQPAKSCAIFGAAVPGGVEPGSFFFIFLFYSYLTSICNRVVMTDLGAWILALEFFLGFC